MTVPVIALTLTTTYTIPLPLYLVCESFIKRISFERMLQLGRPVLGSLQLRGANGQVLRVF